MNDSPDHPRDATMRSALADLSESIEHFRTSLTRVRREALATGILMATHNLTESAAQELLHRLARETESPYEQRIEQIITPSRRPDSPHPQPDHTDAGDQDQE